MRKLLAALAFFASPLAASDKPAAAPSPAEIVEGAPPGDWTAIAPADLLVMELAADSRGRERRVVIQLMPPPFSQGWVGNIRRLAMAHWWDGLSINRVQDNYVVQWGDADGENRAKARALPGGLNSIPESCYSIEITDVDCQFSSVEQIAQRDADEAARDAVLAVEEAARPHVEDLAMSSTRTPAAPEGWHQRDSVASWVELHWGWPLAADDAAKPPKFWPVHCYAMVGVGRNLPPDTGSGAELYAVIGHAPRHLDRNIALVGRVIEGIEHLSSLPRGTGALGFYETAEERAPIRWVRMGNEVGGLPGYQYLSTESASFARYANARANRRDAFFVRPAGGADICNIPVPVRRAK